MWHLELYTLEMFHKLPIVMMHETLDYSESEVLTRRIKEVKHEIFLHAKDVLVSNDDLQASSWLIEHVFVIELQQIALHWAAVATIENEMLS